MVGAGAMCIGRTAVAALVLSAVCVTAGPETGSGNETRTKWEWEDMEVKPWDSNTWSTTHFAAWSIGMQLLLALAGRIATSCVGPGLISIGFGTWEPIAPRGKPHVIPGALQGRDFWYMWFNKMYVPVFFYHTVRYMWTAEQYVMWNPSQISVLNTVLATPLLFIVYDFFYSLFHRALHHRKLYAWVHKHHHQQHVPTNGIEDAINEHPFEYLVGEYIHLVAIIIVSRTIGLHATSVAMFALAAAFLPAINHTRMDVTIPGFYRSKHHDQHHVLPNCNYGNYTMFWDYAMGTFVPHPTLHSRAD